MLSADKTSLDTLARAIRQGLDLCHLAVQLSRNPDTLDLIHQQIKCLRRIDAALEALALRLGILFADEPSHEDLARLEALELLAGRRLDLGWMAAMAETYEQIRDAAEILMLHGGETQIRTTAEQIAAVISPRQADLAARLAPAAQRPSTP